MARQSILLVNTHRISHEPRRAKRPFCVLEGNRRIRPPLGRSDHFAWVSFSLSFPRIYEYGITTVRSSLSLDALPISMR